MLQHDPFSWVVEEGDFSSVDSLTSDAKYVDGVVNSWLGKLSPEERERFVDLLFGLIDTENNENTDQLFEQWQRKISLSRCMLRRGLTRRRRSSPCEQSAPCSRSVSAAFPSCSAERSDSPGG